MAENTVDECLEEDCALALALLRRAERHASAGRPDSVRAILAEVWGLVESSDAETVHCVAWQAGWILFALGTYDEAGTWFARISALPVDAGHAWPTARRALLDLCRALSNDPVALVGRPQVWAFRGGTLDTSDVPSVLPSLYVRTLGCFQVVRAGRVPPPCPSRKAGAMLRYLLTRPHRSARREELTDLLWPDAPVREATHSLHVAVSTLRRYLDPTAGSYICLEGGRYSLNPDTAISDDCGEFRRLAKEGERYWYGGDLDQARKSFALALNCYQGDYYMEDDDGWAAIEQERMLGQYVAVLDHVGQVHILCGAFEEAVDCYARLVERDAYREDAHAPLIRCYLQLGWRSAALRQYKRCAAVLERDLGLRPMSELEAL